MAYISNTHDFCVVWVNSRIHQFISCVSVLVPSGSPQNFTVVEDLNSSLLFTWKPIPQEDRNGVILGYDLIFLDHMTNQDENVIVNGSERLHYKKTDIEEYYNYSVAITGRTSIGSSNVPNWAKISNLEKGE